jgi:hypothetical protein
MSRPEMGQLLRGSTRFWPYNLLTRSLSYISLVGFRQKRNLTVRIRTRTHRKTLGSATLSITNGIWIGVILNQSTHDFFYHNHKLQCSETKVMHILFSLLINKGLYMFRALLSHPQEAPHKRYLVYCWRVLSDGCTRTGLNASWGWASIARNIYRQIWYFVDRVSLCITIT